MSEIFIDNNCVFKHNGNKYFIDVRFTYKNGTEERQVVLAPSKIHDVEINVQLNRLFSDGFIIYEDINGDISRMIGVFNNICSITMFKIDTETNGSVNSENVNKEHLFSHNFIVDNIEIINNDEKSLSYCINLTGMEYFNLLNHVNYSDYGSDTKKTSIQIIGELLTKYGKLKIDDTFSKATSGVKLNYISNGNDTVMTSINYLLQKQFFIADNTEKSMKFLTYDFIDDEYGVFQIGQTPSNGSGGTYLPFNKTTLANMMQEDPVKLASVSDQRRSDINHQISQLTIRNYDINSNTFGFKTYSSQQLVNFIAGENNKNVKVSNVDPHVDSYIARDVSEWDNDINVYKDMVDVFMRYDSILLNIGGVVGRRLMDIFVISIDNRIDMINSDKTKAYEEYVTKYSQLRGAWNITKIRYIIKPSENIFHQNLQLSRIGTNA